MNAELLNAGHSRIMIPKVYREDYLGAPRKLSRNNDPSVYKKMLQGAQKFSSQLIAFDFDDLKSQLQSANTFKESDQAVLKF